MLQRNRIENKIKQKEQEIHELEINIMQAKSYLLALNDMLKMLPRENNGPSKPMLRAGTEMAKVRDLLELIGKPMHLNEILKSMGKENTKNTRAALAGSLAGYVRKGVIFTRPAPNTFGLIDFESISSDDDGPPDGFGTS